MFLFSSIDLEEQECTEPNHSHHHYIGDTEYNPYGRSALLALYLIKYLVNLIEVYVRNLC